MTLQKLSRAAHVIQRAGLIVIAMCDRTPSRTARMLEAILDGLANRIYRIRVEGAEHLPATEGALLVSNHPSYVDPVLLMAAIKPRIRFLMHTTFYRNVLLKPLARLGGAIPIS